MPKRGLGHLCCVLLCLYAPSVKGCSFTFILLFVYFWIKIMLNVHRFLPPPSLNLNFITTILQMNLWCPKMFYIMLKPTHNVVRIPKKSVCKNVQCTYDIYVIWFQNIWLHLDLFDAQKLSLCKKNSHTSIMHKNATKVRMFLCACDIQKCV